MDKLVRMDDIESLKKERERWITRIFLLGLEIAFVFLIPALIAVYVGKRIGGDDAYILPLAAAFIISWTIVIFRYRYFSKKLRILDEAIKEKSVDLENKKV